MTETGTKEVDGWDVSLFETFLRSRHDTCEDERSNSYIMCPSCQSCKLFTLRQDLCASIKFNAFFDNTGAVIFSIFMSVWGRCSFRVVCRRHCLFSRFLDRNSFVQCSTIKWNGGTFPARIFIKLWKKRESTLVFEWAVPEDEMGQVCRVEEFEGASSHSSVFRFHA